MKKCKSCGVPSKNKSYEGDNNPFNKEHCQPCALILNMAKICENVWSQPNPAGQVRNVKLNVEITK